MTDICRFVSHSEQGHQKSFNAASSLTNEETNDQFSREKELAGSLLCFLSFLYSFNQQLKR